METLGLKLRSHDVVARGGEQSLVAPEEHDGRAESSEAERRGLAESATRAGDETHATRAAYRRPGCAGSVDVSVTGSVAGWVACSSVTA